jgi:hypothetical protein
LCNEALCRLGHRIALAALHLYRRPADWLWDAGLIREKKADLEPGTSFVGINDVASGKQTEDGLHLIVVGYFEVGGQATENERLSGADIEGYDHCRVFCVTAVT